MEEVFHDPIYLNWTRIPPKKIGVLGTYYTWNHADVVVNQPYHPQSRNTVKACSRHSQLCIHINKCVYIYIIICIDVYLPNIENIYSVPGMPGAGSLNVSRTECCLIEGVSCNSHSLALIPTNPHRHLIIV